MFILDGMSGVGGMGGQKPVQEVQQAGMPKPVSKPADTTKTGSTDSVTFNAKSSLEVLEKDLKNEGNVEKRFEIFNKTIALLNQQIEKLKTAKADNPDLAEKEKKEIDLASGSLSLQKQQLQERRDKELFNHFAKDQPLQKAILSLEKKLENIPDTKEGHIQQLAILLTIKSLRERFHSEVEAKIVDGVTAEKQSGFDTAVLLVAKNHLEKQIEVDKLSRDAVKDAVKENNKPEVKENNKPSEDTKRLSETS